MFWKKSASFLVIILISLLAFFYIDQKRGFHEDEIFSYGSSNYRYDNIYKSFGYAAADLDYFHNHILSNSPITIISETINFLFHKDAYQNEFDETLKKEKPIWKEKKDIVEYLTIQKSDIFNYFSVYLNQTIDVHPPMFYFAVHFMSGFFQNTFSKYSIFFVNFIAFLMTLLGIYKVMKYLGKEKYAIPTLLLYGLSMGAMSTLLFQRMYMMMTMFGVWYLYFTLRFYQNDLKKKEKIYYGLTIFLGFLTQYYFCIYVVFIFAILSFLLWKEKNFKKWKTLFLLHLIAASVGILFFPASISHIFFSYRGIGTTSNKEKGYLDMLLYYFKAIANALGFPVIFLILILSIFIYFYIKKKERKDILMILFLPILIFILVIAKLSPFLGEDYTSRYIMMLYPILAIGIMYLISIFQKKAVFIFSFLVIIGLSTYHIFTTKPTYLFKDYQEAINISEENQDQYFIYVFDNYFTHLKDLPEMINYKKHMIINHHIYDFTELQKDEELKEQTSIIVCIKSWINAEEILNKIIQNTTLEKIEFIQEVEGTTSSKYYKLSK